MGKYNIKSGYEDVDIVKWKEFVDQHPNGTIFQTPMMYRAYMNSETYDPLIIMIVDDNDEILGLQLSVKEKVMNNALSFLSTRSIIHGGPLILDNDGEILDCVLKEYSKRIKGKAIYSQFRNIWDWGELKKVFESNGFLYEAHLDILIDLSKGEEQLLKEMKRVRRKGINQAYKKGIEVKELDILDEDNLTKAYGILKEVYDRIKLPLQKIQFFKKVISNNSDHIVCLGLFVSGELVAVRLAFCYKNLLYDWYAGAKDEYLSFRPNDVLPWELMKWGVANGYAVFDFGGAGKPDIPYGVRDFKLKFGGTLVEFGRFENIHMPVRMKIAKTGLNILQMIK